MHRLATTYLALASARGVAAQQLEAVGSFDVPAYLGRWFQTHGSATVKYTFELGGNCVTAEYAETGRPGVVAVTNTVRLPKAFGVVPIPSIKIKGAAVQSTEEPGKLEVTLGGGVDPETVGPFEAPGNYWIVRLGPKKFGKYEWSVVSGPDRKQLYILARDPAVFEIEYKKEVLKEVEALGFTEWYNKPLETNQKGCGNYD